MMPEGWNTVTLEEFVTLQRGHDLTEAQRQPGDIPVMGSAGLAGYHNKAKTKGPGVTIGRSGVGAMGMVNFCSVDYWPHNTVLYVTNFHGNNELFVYYLLSSINFRTYDSGGVQSSLNRNHIYSIPVNVPPLPEQRRIAEILSAWDRAIRLTEQRIAAQQQRKRALMQHLLTGKRRENWNVSPLDSIAEIILSNVDKKLQDGEQPVRLCNYMDVFKKRYISDTLPLMEATATSHEIERFRLRKHDVILTKDSETADEIAQAAIVTEELTDVICGYHLAILRPQQDKIHGPFLREVLTVPDIHYQFERTANGVTRFGLTLSAISKVDVPYPSLSEQKKIAAVLQAADNELALLAARRAALQRQKHGLMQQLLTGRVRVPLPTTHTKGAHDGSNPPLP
jgi:type I restriction enzyme S subunit